MHKLYIFCNFWTIPTMYTIHGHTCIKLSSFIKVLSNSKKASRDNKKNN